MIQIFLLLIAGLGLCFAAGKPATLTIVTAYVAINVVYNLGAKHVALLDVFLLSSGFVIRVLLGCALVAAAPSPWLLLCTSTLALFLGFTKRRADLTEELDLDHRPSLRGYSKAFLDQAVSICAGVAILAYALYCIEAKAVSEARPRDGLAAVRRLRNPELPSHGPRGRRRRFSGRRRLSLLEHADLRVRLADRRNVEFGVVVKKRGIRDWGLGIRDWDKVEC